MPSVSGSTQNTHNAPAACVQQGALLASTTQGNNAFAEQPPEAPSPTRITNFPPQTALAPIATKSMTSGAEPIAPATEQSTEQRPHASTPDKSNETAIAPVVPSPIRGAQVAQEQTEQVSPVAASEIAEESNPVQNLARPLAAVLAPVLDEQLPLASAPIASVPPSATPAATSAAAATSSPLPLETKSGEIRSPTLLCPK